jgi:hypothetical protein
MPAVHLAPILPLRHSVETPPDVALRARVRWNALQLDSRLAEGVDPNATEELALRARQLAAPAKREEIARSLDEVVAVAVRGSSAHLPTIRAPISRGRVQASRPELSGLAARLRQEGPHAVEGLAMAHLLVADAQGPLYAHELCGDPLGPAVEAAILAMEPKTAPSS